MCVSQVVVIVDGGILGAILQVFTRYSANNPQFPVNDRCYSPRRLRQSAERRGRTARPTEK
jgi:hypothetical protein